MWLVLPHLNFNSLATHNLCFSSRLTTVLNSGGGVEDFCKTLCTVITFSLSSQISTIPPVSLFAVTTKESASSRTTNLNWTIWWSVKKSSFNLWNWSLSDKITAVVLDCAALQKETGKRLAGDGHFIVNLFDGHPVALNWKICPTSGHCYQKLAVWN